ncbi:MAG: adenosine deaminase [Anaerolineae bacterium]|nr:MAG: adenosine deaminase [Anaerolineae bacterium]
MQPNAPTAPLNIFAALPKVELHRHLEGSLRLSTMVDIARSHGVTVPASILRLSNMVQVQDEEPFTFSNFLEKFKTLRLFYRSPEVIHRITREAIEDAAQDNVRYLELRFTPVALSRAERFPLEDVTDWVCETAQEAAREFDIPVRLIASMNRHESVALAEQVAWIAAERLDRGIVGLDLAGNEAEFDAAPFAPLFREARQAGLRITVHAGEWGGAENVRQAIELLGAERIGHGVRVMEDPSVVALARERGTVFEVCVTSNYQSGVVASVAEHPLPRMLQAGLNVTVNTDDPSVSRINLTHEYRLVCEELGLSLEELEERILAAARAAFLPQDERRALVEHLRQRML